MWSSIAFAAEGAASGGGSSIGRLLFLIGLVAAAYLVAHLVLERAQQRFLFVSGIEYVALGIGLGPVFSQVQPFGDLTRMGPVFAFTAGWVGLLHGLELDLRHLGAVWRPARIAFVDTLVTGTATTGAAWILLGAGLAGPLSTEEVWASALALGAASAAGSMSAIDLLTSRYRDLETQILPTLRTAIRLGNLVAIVASGAVFFFFHQGATAVEHDPGPAGWTLLAVGLGLALGLLFLLFLGRDTSPNHVFLGMVGILLFASGAAFFVHLSAIFVNMVLGLVLAQTPLGTRMAAELERTAKPVNLLVLLFGGALWRPVPIVPGILFVVAYLCVRLVAKASASALATVGTPLRVDLFRGLFAQGNVAVAMAICFRLFYAGEAVDLVFTAVLFGTVLSELGSPRLLRGLLADAGELREDLGPRPEPVRVAAEVA